MKLFWADVINRSAETLAALRFAADDAGLVTAFWALCLAGAMRLAMACAAAGGPAAEKNTVPRWLEWGALAAVTLLGAAVRLYGRDALPYWWDELLAVWLAQSDPATLVRSLATPAAPASDFTPPLFYLLLHGWQNLFGLGAGEARLLTAGASILTVPALYLLGRRLVGPGAGLAAAFLQSVAAPAAFYAQQVRGYSLLALLCVLFLLAADRLFDKPTLRRGLAFLLVSVLFLHSHFVAAWVFTGVCAAQALLLAWRWGGSHLVGLACVWRCCLLPVLFLLAAACPALDAPQWLVARQGLLVSACLWLGLAALLTRGFEPWLGREAGGRFMPLALCWAAAGLSFAPWLLGTRIWAVIAGKGSYVQDFYALADLHKVLEGYSGLGMTPGLFLLGLGFAALLVRRPRAAALVAGWLFFPALLAMLVKNQNMNLGRYLSLTQPGYALLVGVACLEAAGVLARPLEPLLRRGAPVIRGLAAPALLVAVLGYDGLQNVTFPTRNPPAEDYPAVAAQLQQKGFGCIGFAGSNLMRALSWYADLAGYTPQCTQGATRALVYNVSPDGRPWAPGAPLVRLGEDRGSDAAGATGITVRTVEPSGPLALEPTPGGARLALAGLDLLLRQRDGQGLALAGEELRPWAKKREGVARYALDMHEAGRIADVELSLEGIAAGPGSRLSASLRDAQGNVLADVVLTGLPFGQGGGVTRRAVAHARLNEPLATSAALDAWSIELRALDDGSGAIYSSAAAIAKIELQLSR